MSHLSVHHGPHIRDALVVVQELQLPHGVPPPELTDVHLIAVRIQPQHLMAVGTKEGEILRK